MDSCRLRKLAQLLCLAEAASTWYWSCQRTRVTSTNPVSLCILCRLSICMPALGSTRLVLNCMLTLGFLSAGGFGGRSAAAFGCAFALVAAGLTLFSLSGEVQRKGGGYSTLEEQPAQVSSHGPAVAERERLRSCELHANASV